MAKRHARDELGRVMKPAENCCEHGDHAAPPGKRFCSYACQTCEGHAGGFSEGCSGLCERLSKASP